MPTLRLMVRDWKCGEKSWCVEVALGQLPTMRRYFVSATGASACAEKWRAAIDALPPTVTT